jgi:hypothetical protein
MRRRTAKTIGRSLERFAGPVGEATLHDLNLLVDEAALVGRRVLRWSTWRLKFYVELDDPRLGYDAIAEPFCGAPEFPKLREIARKIVAAAGGDSLQATYHFRNEMSACARNHAKRLLQDVNAGGHRIRRNILLHIDPAMRRGNRIYYCEPRPGHHPPISSREHVDELWRCLGSDEGHMPRLLEATTAILAARSEHAAWLDLAQLESDYLEVLTFTSIWLWHPDLDADPGQAVDYSTALSYWHDRGHEIARERFVGRTEARVEDIPRIFHGYCKYFDVWVCTSGRVEQYPFLAESISGLTPERFRREYRRIFQGLHGLAIDVLAERFAPLLSTAPDESGSLERGEDE